MATTPNYGWVTPAPTDFVTDLPADFEIFADAVDASFAADEGDLLVGGTSDIFEALPIGAASTVLTSDGTTASWQPAGASVSEFVQISNTTFNNTVSTVTISGLSGYARLRFYINVENSTTSSPFHQIRFNADSASNYFTAGIEVDGTTIARDFQGGTEILFARSPNTTGANTSGYLELEGCSGAQQKTGHFVSGTNGTTNKRQLISGLRYAGTSVISSITYTVTAGNLVSGNIRILGSVS
jgi:hypothetical protein